MIQGRFGELGELFFEIELIANSGDNFSIEALLDTGFTTGWLLLDIQDVEALGWKEIARRRTMQTASGEAFFALYQGKAIFDRQEYIIPVHARARVPEALLGLQWLTIQRLVADFPQNFLTLESSETHR